MVPEKDQTFDLLNKDLIPTLFSRLKMLKNIMDKVLKETRRMISQ